MSFFGEFQKSQTPSHEVLCTKRAITFNFAGFEIGLICTAAYVKANLISGSLCYSSWSFYSLYSDVKLSNFLFFKQPVHKISESSHLSTEILECSTADSLLKSDWTWAVGVLTTSLSMVKYLEDVSVSCSWYDLEPSDVRSKQLELYDSGWLTTEDCGLASFCASSRM